VKRKIIPVVGKSETWPFNYKNEKLTGEAVRRSMKADDGGLKDRGML
jgi:hypothetical protein